MAGADRVGCGGCAELGLDFFVDRGVGDVGRHRRMLEGAGSEVECGQKRTQVRAGLAMATLGGGGDRRPMTMVTVLWVEGQSEID